jgi:hypothetical protein
MNAKPEELYLDLLKKTLSFTLWPEPPIPIDTLNSSRPAVKKAVIAAIAKTLRLKHLQLVKQRAITTKDREEGRIWPGYADTMIGLRRLDNLQFCVETAIRERIEGDFIETGVWRGGACILMRACLVAHGVHDRRVYVADSFEGLPKPDAGKFPCDKDDKHHTHTFFAVSQREVEDNFRRYGLLDDQVVFLKGWFKDTLPTAPIEKLAVLRLDGDMYESTMVALTSLYPKLSRRGFCIIDDYALPGCRQAVDDFRADHRINGEMAVVDWSGRYWQKE